jgi:hypothetical protein
MNDARRSLLKALPFTALGAFATAQVKAEASVSEVASPERKDTRVIFAFRLTRPAPADAIQNLRENVRSMLDARGFSDAMAFVLPEYLELDIFEIEGANHVRNRNS